MQDSKWRYNYRNGVFRKEFWQRNQLNYFEPFLKKNVSIEMAYKAKENNYAIFKADSDQDRPNKIKDS